MLSRSTVFVLVGVLFAVGNCVPVQHQDAYDRVEECMAAALHAAYEVAPGEPNYKKSILCRYSKVCRRCLVEPFVSNNGSSEILDFFRAHYLQRGILEERSGFCTDPGYLDKLSDLVHKSGIMEKENLVCVGGDSYAPCAGDAYKKCYLNAEKAWEVQADQLSLQFIIISCFKKEAKECDKPMMKHFNDFMQKMKEHLQEKHGLLMNKVEAIEP